MLSGNISMHRSQCIPSIRTIAQPASSKTLRLPMPSHDSWPKTVRKQEEGSIIVEPSFRFKEVEAAQEVRYCVGELLISDAFNPSTVIAGNCPQRESQSKECCRTVEDTITREVRDTNPYEQRENREIRDRAKDGGLADHRCLTHSIATPNGRFLRHRPERSERCLNYQRFYHQREA